MGGQQCSTLPQSGICCNQTCRQVGNAGNTVVRPDLGDSGESWCLTGDKPLCSTAIPQDCTMYTASPSPYTASPSPYTDSPLS